jgi:hypothetical protein
MPHGTARRAMPVNWLVSTKDAAGLGLVAGRYLACQVKADDPVVLQELVDRPKFSPAAGNEIYSVPVDSQSIEDLAINAGIKVQVLRNVGPMIVASARVLAVFCSTSCIAAIEVTPAEIQLLLGVDPSKLHAVAQP